MRRLFEKFKQAVIQLPFRLLPSQGEASWAVSLGGSPPDMKTVTHGPSGKSKVVLTNPMTGETMVSLGVDKGKGPSTSVEGLFKGEDGKIVKFDEVTGAWVEVTGLPPVKKKKGKPFQKQVGEDDLMELLSELVEDGDDGDDGNDDFVDFAGNKDEDKDFDDLIAI